MREFSKKTLAVAVGLTLMQSAPVFSDQSFLLEEVIVTAQKREESTSDVPLSISAFSDNFIKQAKVNDMKDLIKFTPGLSGQSKDSFVDNISVRGVSSNAFGIGGDPSVGIYKDGVYVGRNGAAMSSFYDVARVEVLKGPQGLLFGRNAASGAIHTITARPSLESSDGYLKLGAGENGRSQGEFSINQPLSEQWALRVAGAHSEERGFIKNLSSDGNDNLVNHNRDAMRISLRHEAEWGDATLITEYEDREQSGAIYIATDANRKVITGDDRTANSNWPDLDESEVGSATLDINVNLSDDLTLSSVTGFVTHNFTYQADVDGTPDSIIGARTEQNGDYFSQELRLNGDGEQLQWFAGVSFYREDIEAVSSNTADESTLCFLSAGDPTCGGFFVPGTLVETSSDDGDYQGWAVYGDMTYSVTEKLDVSFGVRYTEDEKDFKHNVEFPTGNLGPNVFPYYTAAPVLGSETWEDISPRIAMRYFLDNGWLVYGNITKGYKSGGFGSTPADKTVLDGMGFSRAAVGAKAKSFDPETIHSYEFGVKGDLADGRVLVNANVYFYDFEDLQLATVSNGTVRVDNLGQVDGFGAEFDIKAAPTDYLDVFFAIAWSKTDADEISLAACNEPTGKSCNGNRLPFNPEWTVSGGVIGRHSMDSGEVYAGVDFSWQSRFYGGLDNTEVGKTDALGIVNFRAGWSNDAWEVAAYVENLFDKEGFDAHDTDFTSYAAGPIKPRIAGVDITYHFSM